MSRELGRPRDLAVPAAVNDVDALVWRYRLVFVGAVGVKPRALVYAAEANAFATPLGYFELVPFQELPRCESGSVFQFTGPLLNGSPVTAHGPDGTVVRSLGTSRTTDDSMGRMFAERDSSVLIHPGMTGTAPSWRHASSTSPLTTQERDRYLRRERKVAAWWITVGSAALVCSIVLLVLLLVHDMAEVGRIAVRVGALSVLALVGGIGSLRRARRALRVLAVAREAYSRPASNAYARVWWSVGNGWGPVAMVTLASIPHPTPDAIIGHEPVVNLRLDTSLPGWCPAEVLGEIVDGGSIVVRSNGLELWPADALMTTLPAK